MFDLHSHILPGIDDGAVDSDHSLTMARLAVADGIQGIICTPHWLIPHFDNTREKVLEAVRDFERLLREKDIPLKVYPGTELRFDADLPQKLESRELLTMNDTGRFALVELHEGMIPHNIENLFWDMQLANITPVLAHPERNSVLARDPSRLSAWIEMGVLLQITTGSVLGRFGPDIQRFVVLLLEHDMAHILATDSHGTKSRRPRLSPALRAVSNIVGSEAAHRMVEDIPRMIIEGQSITVPDPIPLGNRSLKPSLFKRFFSFWGAAAPTRQETHQDT
jgi:protein-tyrosine phosphatase